MNKEKLLYLLTPPLMYRLWSELRRRLASGGLPHLPSESVCDAEMLGKLRKEKMGYFFNDKLVDEFCDVLEEHFQRNGPIPAGDPSNQGHLNTLIEYGVCKVEGLFSNDQIRRWHDRIYSVVLDEEQTFKEYIGQFGIATARNIETKKNLLQINFELRGGYIRAWDVELLDESLNNVRQNTVIKDICSSYLGGKANESRIWAEYKFLPLSKDPNLQLHADSPFKNLKVFIPLVDITLDNAPFVYHRKSHRLHEWRILKDYLSFAMCNSKYGSVFGTWGDPEVGRLADRFPDIVETESLLTAKAGDVIIADTRGVHGGSLLVKNYRLQLAMSFGMLGDFDIGNIPERIKKLSRKSV